MFISNYFKYTGIELVLSIGKYAKSRYLESLSEGGNVIKFNIWK